MAASNTYAAPPSASATSPTTSPAASSRPAASDTNYTLECDEPDKLNWFYRTGAVALILFALALQFGPSLAGPTESGGSEDAPAVAPD
ncbi:MAG TPA: hypothetical protein VIK32_10395, partial [Candidatus Limnocylindrales bacterium]